MPAYGTKTNQRMEVVLESVTLAPPWNVEFKLANHITYLPPDKTRYSRGAFDCNSFPTIKHAEIVTTGDSRKPNVQPMPEFISRGYIIVFTIFKRGMCEQYMKNV